MIVFILMFFGVMGAHAQTKQRDFFDDGIPKEVKAHYMEALNDLNQEWIPGFIDSLRNEGAKNGKKELKCLSDMLSTYEYMVKGDSLHFAEMCDVTIAELNELHSNRLYFNLMANRVAFYSSVNDFYTAQKIARQLIDETENIKDGSGMVNGFICLGLLLAERKEYIESNKKYAEAIEAAKEVGGDQRELIAQLQSLIAYNLSMMGSYTKAIEYAKLSIKTSDTEPDTRVCIAYCYYKQGNIDEFKKAYNDINAHQAKNSPECVDRFEYLTAVYQAVNKNFDAAFSMCDSIESDIVTFSALAEVYRHQGNWEKAFDCYQHSRELNDSALHAEYSYMLASADRELDTMKELQAKEEEIRKTRTIVAYAIAVVVVLVIIVAFAMWMNIMQRKVNRNRIESIRNEKGKLEIAKANAEEASNTKTAFVQNMSHDVRTPLNAIIGFAQLLGMPDGANTEEEKAEYNMHIMNNAEMLMMLLDDILNIGDIEKGNFAINKAAAKCNDLCNKILKTVEYRVPFKVELKFTTNVDDDYAINTDSKRVQQVLTNFLTNACKHTTEGEIVLDCNVNEEENTIRFTVTDTGEGVPEDMRKDLFERFVHRGTSDSHGIGLDICNTIAKKMDGTVGLDMDYYDGARFYFVLDLEKA